MDMLYTRCVGLDMYKDTVTGHAHECLRRSRPTTISAPTTLTTSTELARSSGSYVSWRTWGVRSNS